MARSTPLTIAPKDSPIYSGKFVVSSMKYSPRLMKSKSTMQKNMASQEMQNSTPMSQNQMMDQVVDPQDKPQDQTKA